MSTAADHVSLPDAVQSLAIGGDVGIGRQRILDRAALGLLIVRAQTYETIAPKDFEDLETRAYKAALKRAGGDKLAAGLAMEGWFPPAGAAWERFSEVDSIIPKELWSRIPLHDGVWEKGTFLGRLPRFPGVEQNWLGIYLDRSDLTAMGAIFPAEHPQETTALPTVATIKKPAVQDCDAPYVEEILRRFAAGACRSLSGGAAEIILEERKAGRPIRGQSDAAIERRLQRKAKQRSSG